MQVLWTILRETLGKAGILVFLAVFIFPSGIYAFPVPQIPFAPRQYFCQETQIPIVIDGLLDDAPWVSAPWSSPFVDIEGDDKTPPGHLTQMRMVWSQEYLYVGAMLMDSHLWGTMKKRDSVIYYDNDFEVFIDPDGDNHQYYELEINALGTEWDLRLEKPYRDGGPAIDSWDIAGLQTAIHYCGTINDPSDTDVMWSVEIAIPWAALAEFSGRPSPPQPQDIWRMNFSRVQWETGVVEGQYAKKINPETGRHFPESNWVWSPQGLIAMHYPEMWGEVMFTDSTGAGDFATSDQHLHITSAQQLMPIYYAQKQYFEDHGQYASSLAELDVLIPEIALGLEIFADETCFEVNMKTANGSYSVDETGQLLKGGL